MNNPYKLNYAERGITPAPGFNEGINRLMPKERRKRKQARHRENVANRGQGRDEGKD